MAAGALLEPRQALIPAGLRGLLGGVQALYRLPREQAIGRLAYLAKQPLFSLPPYRWTLARRLPTALYVSPSDPWPGDAETGRAILQGRFTLAGRSLDNPAPLWAPVGADQRWVRAINGFSWLRDLRAAGGDGARRAARELVAAWIGANERWDPIAWDPVVIGDRLTHWLGQYDFYAASAEVDFRHRLLGKILEQARHLHRIVPAGLAGREAITAIKGLIYAGACLPGAEDCLTRGLRLLARELPRQIAADGGHVERSPASQMRVLRDLIDIRALLVTGEIPVPGDLQTAIETMTPMLKLFRHGDGGLALFNDSNEDESWLLDMVIERAGRRGRALMNAPMSGFQRLQSGRTLVIVDAGAPPPAGADGHAHAGTLSFEMSVGRERLIVNCGAHSSAGAWRLAQRATAAHSTLTLGDTNSSQIAREGALTRRPELVTCRREESEGDLWVDLSHDGYQRSHGLVHHRRLYLRAGGEDLRGEDRLEGSGDTAFTLRFHLHPEVQGRLAQNGETVLLKLPKGGGWRMRCQGAAIGLEESVYLGRAGVIRRSLQVVLTGQAGSSGATIKWALQREAKPRAKR